MKKITFLFAFCFLFSAFCLYAQHKPITDGSFEKWTPKTSPYFGPYLEFETDLFYTLNSLIREDNSAGPADITAFRENKSEHATTTQNANATIQNGVYCIRLTSGKVAAGTSYVFLPGMVGTISQNFVQEFLNPVGDGVVITKPWEIYDTPHFLEGYYKYKPVEGDSALIDIGFFYQSGNGFIESLIIKGTVTDKWEKFSLKIPEKYWGEIFDEIRILFVASAGVNFEHLDECVGQLGSTLWLDNVSLDYITLGGGNIKQNLFSTLKANAFPNPATEVLNIELNEEFAGKVVVYNLSGSLILEENINGKLHQINTSTLATGNYIYKLMNENTIFAQGKFVVAK
jgi:hypothetical protein